MLGKSVSMDIQKLSTIYFEFQSKSKCFSSWDIKKISKRLLMNGLNSQKGIKKSNINIYRLPCEIKILQELVKCSGIIIWWKYVKPYTLRNLKQSK